MLQEYLKSLALRVSIRKITVFPLIFLIHLYRYTLSPVFGNDCRYEPTCSRYAEEALRKHGAIGGSIMALKRVLRCHPWHEGGYDPVK
ncbi:MAG: membrane protein insertion efficiency factor YidD [Candidatus Zixiibacteriota bacterium]|nr:MAG: membrane protein insertion efficiency factor YidD [candidate division Zixibacteria bacterium]